jgi:HAD superfamily hydrolase (TIGR01549 family)
VQQSVIDSEWVPGFLNFIERYQITKKHILVTATPKEEIEEILQDLNIRHFFYKIYGAPVYKSAAISETLRFLKTKPEHAIMLGDSESDYLAAKENNVLFLLRATELNSNLRFLCKNYVFKDFIDE